VTVAALWRPEFWRITLMLWVAWFCISLAYYGVFSWLPQLFVQRGFAFVQTYQYVFILALAQLPGYFSAAYLVEVWGRRPTLAAYLAASGIFAYLFAAVVGDLWVVAAAVLMSFFSLGAWGALYAYTPELYSTEIRATGMGWASGMTRLAGSIAPTLGGALLQYADNIIVPLTVWAAAFIVGGAVVGLLGVETRGKPLADTVEAVPKAA
jgi:putative MFS transporter